MKSKNEIIVSSFEKMDIGMLQMVLDDDKTYQNAHKVVFLAKLDKVFNEFQSNHDTCLKAYKGKCVGNCPNKGINGFSFFGNTTKNHLDLLFEEKENEIVDICCCTDFEIEANIEVKNKKVSFDMYHDELFDFQPSVDYHIASAKYKEAYEEMEAYFDKEPIDKDIYMYWMGKHNELFIDSINVVIDNFHQHEFEFYALYDSLLTYSTSYINEEPCKSALTEFYCIDPEDEQSLLKWLFTHESLGHKFCELVYNKIDTKTNSVPVGRLKLSTLDFQNSIDFKTIFGKLFWAMMEKYTEFSKEYVFENDISFSACSILLKEKSLIK